MEVIGRVVRVLCLKPESGFCILSVVCGSSAPVKVLGTMAGGVVAVGDEIECEAVAAVDPRFGDQFKASVILKTPPRTAEGVERYLASGVVKGIGPALAKRLVEWFGAKVFEVIDNEPERLMEIPGLGAAKVEALRGAWAEQRIVRSIMIFLRSYDMGEALANRIYKAYGDRAVVIIQEDPYRLSREITGVGFRTADKIALSLGLPADSMKRLRSGVIFAMRERAVAGHCAATMADLLKTAAKLLEHPDHGSPALNLLRQAIQDQLGSGALVLDRTGGAKKLYLADLFRQECGVAEGLARLMQGSAPWKSVDRAWAVRWAQNHTGMTLAESQQEALWTALTNKVVIVTGGPGTGKTTLLNSILGVVTANELRVTLCAPTGRAAKRLSEATGMEGKTIHRTLGFDPAEMCFSCDSDNPLETDLVVVDESSMVDVNLMDSLLAAIPDHAALMLVGDQDQLPSVGPGSVLGDLIESKAIPTVRLTEIFRQAEGSLIVKAAHQINRGGMPVTGRAGDEGADFFVICVDGPEAVQGCLLEVVSKRIPERYGLDPMRDVQVLTPMHKNTVGTVALNAELRKLLNKTEGPRIARYGQEFAVGDKVFQTVNNYKKEVFNGDLGFVHEIDLEAGNMVVSFDGRAVTYPFEDLDSLALAYATTIHKSQGSEYPAVVIPLAMEQSFMLERSLLYTAVTRGKQLVVIVCEEKALGMAVRTFRSRRRVTGLVARLEERLGRQCA